MKNSEPKLPLPMVISIIVALAAGLSGYFGARIGQAGAIAAVSARVDVLEDYRKTTLMPEISALTGSIGDLRVGVAILLNDRGYKKDAEKILGPLTKTNE